MFVLSRGKAVVLPRANNNTRLVHSSAFIVLLYCSCKLLIYAKTHKAVFLRYMKMSIGHLAQRISQ